MKLQTKLSLALAAGVGLLLVVLLSTSGSNNDGDTVSDERAKSTSAGDRLVRDDSHVLGVEGSSDVVLVEFLDFECEGCAAAYPIVEALREQYAGEVTFVARYFPLPGHFNGERAARAVESAARQGKFEEMYRLMFETQAEWGEQRVPADQVFRQFAIDIGLDVDQYDRDYASQEVADRVQADIADGNALGLQGTPSFFLDGKPFMPRTLDDFTDALDAALAE